MAFVDLKTATDLLKSEQVVALPTETVYGLAGRIDSESALKKIFEVKKRPFFDPLIVHLSTEMSAKNWTTQWPSIYDLLAKKFWPGPLTLIAPKNNSVSDLITSGLTEVALRCPNHPLIQSVLKDLGIPLAAPSANLFGKTSPTEAKHVEAEFEGRVPVLDGGPCAYGLESTVVRFDSIANTLEVLRPGWVSIKDLEGVVGTLGISVLRAESKVSPGHLKHHYQPNSPLALIFSQVDSSPLDPIEIESIQEKLSLPKRATQRLNLNSPPEQVARRLYSDLRRLSLTKEDLILAELPLDAKNDPDWTMIIDRLEKASSLVVLR